MTVFEIKTPVFEGPLDLLLSLIEKRKLLINDISLAAVADDYMAHLQTMEKFPMDHVAHFVLIASTLVLIKSRSLLPGFIVSSEEEADINDLEARLKLYQAIQELSRGLRDRFGKQMLYTPLASPQFEENVFAPHQSITVSSLRSAIDGIMARFPKVETLQRAIVEKIMSLEDMMSTLAGRIQQALKMSFSQFAGTHRTSVSSPREIKVNTIVSFLAMLELVKQGILMVEQRGRFEEIHMETERVGLPNYSA
jgi:segregation and condensation protein A